MRGAVPKAAPVRRNARTGPQKLPAGRRTDPPPPWPLEEQSDVESRCWDDLWSLPQSVAWRQHGNTRIVARLCRLLVIAESPGNQVNAAEQAAVVALEDRLGLSPKAMRALLWEVADDELAEARTEPAAPNARARMSKVRSA